MLLLDALASTVVFFLELDFPLEATGFELEERTFEGLANAVPCCRAIELIDGLLRDEAETSLFVLLLH